MSKAAYLIFASIIIWMVTVYNYSITDDTDSGSRTHSGGYTGGYSGSLGSGSSGGHK